MDFLEIAKKRYSVRKYTNQEVSGEKLDLILEAGRIAPTGANRQPQRLIVIQNDEGLKKLNKTANTFGAPVAIIVCADTEEVWKRPYDGKKLSDIDTSIVTDHMMLQATELGLGSVWICYFDPKIIKEEFQLPDHIEPVNVLVLGYANDKEKSPDRHDSERKALIEIVFYENL